MMCFGEIKKNVEYISRKGAYAIIVDENEQLALIKTPRGFFLPGGGVEEGESPVQCLQRELIEEMGCRVDVGNYVCESALYGISPKDNKHYKLIGKFYWVKILEKVHEPLEKDHKTVWVELDQAEEIIKLPHQKWSIQQYKKECGK